MKKLLLTSLLTLALAIPAFCQTNNNNPSVTAAQDASFVSTVQSYFTSFDTNSQTFHRTNEVDVLVGADTQAGITSASLGLSYNLWKAVSIEEVTRGAGIGGVIVSQQLGVSVRKVIYDVNVQAYLDGGWSFTQKGMYAEVGLRALKAATANTFYGVGIAAQIDKTGVRTPVLSIFTGFTF